MSIHDNSPIVIAGRALSKQQAQGLEAAGDDSHFPWLIRMFPHARYVFVVRDPKDGLLGRHPTDDLDRFKIPHPNIHGVMDRRVAFWKYQYDIVKATPKPANFISVRYEDLVLDQTATLRRLEDFLGIPLARVVVDETRIGRWRSKPEALQHLYPIEGEMRECGYDLPREARWNRSPPRRRRRQV